MCAVINFTCLIGVFKLTSQKFEENGLRAFSFSLFFELKIEKWVTLKMNKLT